VPTIIKAALKNPDVDRLHGIGQWCCSITFGLQSLIVRPAVSPLNLPLSWHINYNDRSAEGVCCSTASNELSTIAQESSSFLPRNTVSTRHRNAASSTANTKRPATRAKQKFTPSSHVTERSPSIGRFSKTDRQKRQKDECVHEEMVHERIRCVKGVTW